LDEVKKDFEDVVFQLANAQLKLYAAPAFSPFIIIIAAILIGVIFLVLLRRKREKRRPKLLREVSEET
jgi:LPXTG-motif cell wall-anchored protein